MTLRPLARPAGPRRLVALLLTASVLIALVCAVASITRVSGFPPKLERRGLQSAGAATHVMVDLQRSSISDRSAEWPYFHRMSTRADLLAHLMASKVVVEHIARRAHVQPQQIAAVAPFGMQVVDALTEPGSEGRARELLLAGKPYRLEIQSAQDSPIVDIYAQAPTPAQAERLADAAISGARDYLRRVAAGMTLDPAKTGVDPDNPVRIVQLDAPRGMVLNRRARIEVAALTFLLAFAVACAALFGLATRRGAFRAVGRTSPEGRSAGSVAASPRRATVTAAVARASGALSWPVPVVEPGGVVSLRPASRAVAAPRTAAGDGDWPRTNRVLPWMLAGFMVLLWLVPFDSIKLAVPSPIELQLDRLVLPVVAATWGLVLLLGGRGAPRLRVSWIHAAVGAFVAVAFLSVILDAGSLTRSLEFDTAVKKLPLLLSYPAVFLMFASIVRREEVAAFLKLTLVLAVICALGMVWEDRASHNLFFEWSDKLLPGAFHVGGGEGGWDTMGRRFIHGPTTHPLAAAGMLSMAFPIAVLGVIRGREMRGRILYALAAVVLMVGVFSTERKTGLVAPVAGLVTLACFRRRELLRLAPLGLVFIVVLLMFAPGTVAPVIDQFKPDNLSSADTVNDRASDYDAIRPDFWSHVALGRGYGTYEPGAHRTLDSQVLGAVIEMGAIGLVAFVLLGLSVVASARRTIHDRHPRWAPSALAGATAAVVFLVLALLFDSLAFPQLPYVFMCFAGLVAVVVRPREDGERIDQP